MCKTITCGFFDKNGNECASDCFYSELRVKSLKAIYVKTQKEIATYEELESKGLGKTEFNEHRYEEEQQFDYRIMLGTLKDKKA